MKYILLLIIATAFTGIQAQEAYTLKGKLNNLNDSSKIYLQYLNSGERITDSAKVSKGRFTFNGMVEEPSKAVLIVSLDGQSLDDLIDPAINSVFLSKGTIRVEGDSLATAKIFGTKINVDYANYLLALKTIEQQYVQLNTIFEEANENRRQSETFIDSLEKLADEIDDNELLIKKNFVKKNPKSYISMLVLSEVLSPSTLVGFVLPAFENLSNALKFSTKGKDLSKRIDQLKNVAIGSIAPDFQMPDTADRMIALSSLRGKYVLIDFWASWCGPCRIQNPAIVAAFNKYKDKNFTVFGVSLDYSGKRDAWLKAIKKDNLQQWPNVSELNGFYSSAALLYNVKVIPQNFLVDPEGIIIDSNLKGAALEQKLKEILE